VPQDPLQGADVNVGRNCFRMLQIQKALADASRALDAQLLAAGDSGSAGGGAGGGAGARALLLDGLICTRVALA
jgi:hypothetical protein